MQLVTDRSLRLRQRYQTVYAARDGSVAAPTAGLHFTPGLLETVQARGVKLAYITMHISYGTFSPIKTENVAEHRMYEEYYKIDNSTAEAVNKAHDTGRLIAVGTSTVRTIEAASDENGVVLDSEGETDLYIYPGYEFRSGIDILITNLHLPKSTLILLVSAFAGKDRIFNAYQEAIRQNYRFYSFGDAMFVYRQ
jgi:S-adenosylmethionine:tRNA ribosyltransferase-isomerase